MAGDTPQPGPVAPLLAIKLAVAEQFGISVEELCGGRRAIHIARPRQVAMVLARELTGYSLPRIGRAFGRDHTTVMHAQKLVPELMLHDVELARKVEALRRRLHAEIAALTGADTPALRRLRLFDAGIAVIRRRLVAAAVAAGAVLAGCTDQVPAPPSPAMAAGERCAGRQGILDHLARAFGEQPVARGDADSGVVEITAGPLGSWTLLVTRPTGETCVIESGVNARFRVPAPTAAPPPPTTSPRKELRS